MPPDLVRLPVNYDLYCAACPREELVTNLLKEAGYTLVKQLAVPAQYHYEGAYGVTIIYVAGYDSSCDAQGKHPPKHAARFYARGNTDPRSQERLQQVMTALKRLPVPFLRIKSHQQVSA